MLIPYDVESGLQASFLTAIPSFGPFGIYRHNLKVLINLSAGTMINFQLRKYAKSQSTQRNINIEKLKLVLEYGTDVPAGLGTNWWFLRQYQF